MSMQSLLSFFIGVGLIAILPLSVHAASDDVTVYLFYGEGCPHCAKEEVFLDSVQKDGIANVERFEVWHNADNLALAQKVAAALGTSVTGVPFTVVKDRSFTGWSDDDTSARQLVALVNALRGTDAPDVVAQILQGGTGEANGVTETGTQGQTEDTQGGSIPSPQAGTNTNGPTTSAYASVALLVLAAAGIGYAIFTSVRGKKGE